MGTGATVLRRLVERTPLRWICLCMVIAGCSSPGASHPAASASAVTTRAGSGTAAAPVSTSPPLPLPLPPTPRSDAALAYDGINLRMLLFGGRNAAGPLGDTYAWNGTQWSQLRVSGPSPRSRATMAWDPAAREVVLVGQASTSGPDTWVWNGGQWTAARPVHHPEAGPSPQLCWDDATQQLVLVGVTSSPGAWQTWTWSGNDWTLQAAGVTPDVNGGSCAFNADAHSLYLTAPALAAAPGGQPLLGVLAWDGLRWTAARVAAPGPGPTVLIPDYAEHDVVAVTAAHATSWLDDGAGSRPVTADSRVRDGAAYGYYPALSLVVAVGGRDASGAAVADVSAWDGRSWNALP